MRVSDSLRFAKVIKVYREAQAVDIRFTDDGSTAPMVKVLCMSAGTDFGTVDLPDAAVSDSNSLEPTNDRDVYVAVAFSRNRPIVLGFLPPEVCQILFKDGARRIMRHASDVYTAIDDKGNFELFHPSGTYLRIGATPAHEDLTGLDFDKKWKISKNTDAAVHVHLGVSNGGVQKASLDIDPSGNIALQNNGTLTANTTGNVDLTTPRLTLHGDLHVTGAGTFDGDVTISSKSFLGHKHGGVTTGSGQTGAPA